MVEAILVLAVLADEGLEEDEAVLVDVDEAGDDVDGSSSGGGGEGVLIFFLCRTRFGFGFGATNLNELSPESEFSEKK